eukprot:TRINITY_DN49248_c0_g1_i1.p1 TRINITY_DN49248_c0_g1~~TRINITY_DN49248_c0_g1_i1.p1  ORF type:complete len:139 (+),score=11.38 TRINITY_DN49248_c0_g1_i1:55-417(+)
MSLNLQENLTQKFGFIDKNCPRLLTTFQVFTQIFQKEVNLDFIFKKFTRNHFSRRNFDQFKAQKSATIFLHCVSVPLKYNKKPAFWRDADVHVSAPPKPIHVKNSEIFPQRLQVKRQDDF